MPMPPKRYFPLAELAAAWGATSSEIDYCILDGLLQISVMTVNTPAEGGWLVEADRGREYIVDEQLQLSGPQPVSAGDLWPVLRTGVGRIRRFKASSDDRFLALAENVEDLVVSREELLITDAERRRFEEKYELGPSVVGASSPSFGHNANYTEVTLSGRTFRLGLLQAHAVRLLHEASMTDDPWRSGKQLLAGSKSPLPRMSHTFKSQPNWRSLILSDQRGRYRLNVPRKGENIARALRRFGFVIRAVRT